MKKEFSARPEALPEPMLKGGKVSWQEFVTAIPEPVFLVTGWKKNGKENACLQSWATFGGSGPDDFVCLMMKVNRRGHMYRSLKKTGVCVLNFPSHDIFDRCIKTIGNNQFETDEITAAGLTAEPAAKVDAPRIKECFLNIECKFLWAHQVCKGCSDMAVAVKAVSICMDSDRYDQGKLGRYGKSGYQYINHGPFNPDTEEMTDWGGTMAVAFEAVDPIPWETK